MIENISALITKRYGKKIAIDDISNNTPSIEEAKARVQKILDSGIMKRKKIKKFNARKDD